MRITQFTITVRDYDEAIAFYVNALGFRLVEDTVLSPTKRWVRVAPPMAGTVGGEDSPTILLAKAASPEQLASVGNQTGGRVFVFLETDNVRRDYDTLRARGVEFVRPPSEEPFGTVAVFKDLYGNLFDLIHRR